MDLDTPQKHVSTLGYVVFRNVLTPEETNRLRQAGQRHFKRHGRPVLGGGMKQSNAVVEIPEMSWLFYHPAILRSFRQALGTDAIMFTNHSDLQKDVLNGWHKDDGTDGRDPNQVGYFPRFAYDADDCRVYKAGVYLEDHHLDHCGLWVREGSHLVKDHGIGAPVYTAPRCGDVVIFDVRVTHSGQFKTFLQRQVIKIAGYAPKPEAVERAFTRARRAYRTILGRERMASFFTFGLSNALTIEFAKSNMSRQIADTPGTNPFLPANIRREFEKAGVALAEDHFKSDSRLVMSA
jgi:hypothetical protein